MSNSNPKPGLLTSMRSMFQPDGVRPGKARSSVAAKMVVSLVVILLTIAGIQIADPQAKSCNRRRSIRWKVTFQRTKQKSWRNKTRQRRLP